jgi:hypothetical protein
MVEKMANEIGGAADAYITADHCLAAVAALFLAMSRHGWKLCPPSSDIPSPEKTSTIEHNQNRLLALGVEKV